MRDHLHGVVAADAARPLAFARALLEHTHEYEPIYRALLGRRTAEVVRRSWLEVVAEFLWELLSWWSEQPRRASAVDLAETYRRLTMGRVA